jgi:hypothetical protein
MITEYLRTREPLIEGKGEVSNKASVGKKGPFQQIIKIPLHKYMVVVILGGHIEGVRICPSPIWSSELWFIISLNDIGFARFSKFPV